MPRHRFCRRVLTALASLTSLVLLGAACGDDDALPTSVEIVATDYAFAELRRRRRATPLRPRHGGHRRGGRALVRRSRVCDPPSPMFRQAFVQLAAGTGSQPAIFERGCRSSPRGGATGAPTRRRSD